jgi:tetratricopeptide (TPR) repeat protein
LDAWATRRYLADLRWQPLAALAGKADDDPWRGRLREAFLRQDHEALQKMAQDQDVLTQKAATVFLLGEVLAAIRELPLAVDVFTRGQRRHPHDFWINNQLAWHLMRLTPPRPGEAVGYYRAALAQRPDDSVVHNNLGNALMENGQLTEAESEFRQAMRAVNLQIAARYNLGNVLVRQGKFLEGERELREVIRLEPKHGHAQLQLGIALKSQQKFSESQAEYRKAIDLLKGKSPRSQAIAYSNLGTLLSDDIRDYDSAVAFFELAIQIDTDNPTFHYNLGLTLGRQGKPAEATQAFDEAIRLKKDWAELHYQRGIGLHQQGKLAESEAAFREATRLKPRWPEPHYELGVVIAAQNQRNFWEATTAWREAVYLKADYGDALNNLGLALFNLGKLPEAEVELRKARRCQANDADVRYNLGLVLEKRGQAADAETEFRKALEIQPGYVSARHGLGRVLLDQRKPSDAAEELHKVLEAQPKLATAHLDLGRALAILRKLPDAEAEFKQAVALQPDQGKNHFFLGRALADQGKWLEAAAATAEAVRLDPKSAKALLQLGAACARIGRWHKAAAAYDRAVELDPRQTMDWLSLAALCLRAGDVDGYRRACGELLDRFGNSNDPMIASQIAQTCSLAPGAVPDAAPVRKLAEQQLAGTEKHRFYRSFLVSRATADYRGGRHLDAIRWVERYDPKLDGNCVDAMAFAVLAMAQHGQGDVKEAQQALSRAQELVKKKMPDTARARWYGDDWIGWVHCQILLREAEEMLKEQPGRRNG